MTISAAGPSNPIPSPPPGLAELERKHFTAQLSKVEHEYVLKLCNEKIVMKPKPNPQWDLLEQFRGMVLPEISFTLQSFYDYLKLYKPKIIGGYITGSTTNYSLTHEKHPQTAIPHNDIDVCFYAGVGPKFKDFRYHIFKLLHSFFFQAVRRQSRPLANQLETEWLQSFDLAVLYGKEANTDTDEYECHKTRYETFRNFLWNFYLTKETNKPDKFYLITLGNVDIKIYDKIEDYVDVALQDGFHISLDDDRHVLCINNHKKCTERQYRGALNDTEQRIYTISNWQAIRNLLFRVSFKMTQGYYFPLQHEIFPGLIANVLKENHLNQFLGYCSFVRECTNHQLNHYSRSEYGRMVDLINTIGLGIIACKDRKISSTELTHFVKPLIKSWSNSTSNVKYLSRFVNILRDDPSQAANLLKLVRGLYFLKWLKGDPNIEGYHFAFGGDKPIRFQFGASLVENQKKATYYLAFEESADPLTLAYDFFEGWTTLNKQIKNPGHLTDLPKDFGFDDLSLKDPISFLKKFISIDDLSRLKSKIEALSKLDEDHPLTSNFKEFCAKLLQLFPEIGFKEKLELYQIAYESEVSLLQANQGSLGLIHQLQKLLHEQPPQLASLATTLTGVPSSEPLLADKKFCHILEQALLSVLKIESDNPGRQHVYAIIAWAETNRVMTPLNAQSFYIAILEAYKDIAQNKNLEEDLFVLKLAQKCLNADKITATRMEHLVHGIADKWLSVAEKQLDQSNGEAVAIIKDILPIILKMEKYRERAISLFMTVFRKASKTKEIQEAEVLLQSLCLDEGNHRVLQELLETELSAKILLLIESSTSDKFLLLLNSLCTLPSLQQFKGKIACIKVNDLEALFTTSLEILFNANSRKGFDFIQNTQVKIKAKINVKITQSILSNIQQHARGKTLSIIASAFEFFEFLGLNLSENIEMRIAQLQLNAYLLEAYTKDPASDQAQAIALVEKILESIKDIKKGQLTTNLTTQLNDSLLIISRSFFSTSQSWGIKQAVKLEALLKQKYETELYRITNVLAYLSLMLNPITKEQVEKSLDITNLSDLGQDMIKCIESVVRHSMETNNQALIPVALDALCVFLQPHLIAKHIANMPLIALINDYLAFIIPHIGFSVQREDAAKCIRLVFTKNVIDVLTRHPLLKTGVALFHVGFTAGYNVNLLEFCTPLLLRDLLCTFVHKQMQEPASAACMQALHDIFTKFLKSEFLSSKDNRILFKTKFKQSWSTYSKALPDRMAMFLSFLSLMKFHFNTNYKDAAVQYGFTVLQAWQEDHTEHEFLSELLKSKSENLYALLNFLRGMFFMLPLKKHPARTLQSFKEGSSLLISLHNECATSLVKDFIGSWIMLKKTVQDPKLQKHLSELPQLFGKAFTRLDFANESDRLHHIKDLIPTINQQSGTLEERIDSYEWISKNGELDFEATAQLNLEFARTQLEQEKRMAAKDSNILNTQLLKEIQSFIDTEPHAFFTHFSNWAHTCQKDMLTASVCKIILCLFKRAYTKVLSLDSLQAGYAAIKQAFDLNFLSHGEVAEALTLVLQQCFVKIKKPEFAILALRILQEIPCTEESPAQFNTIAASLNKHFSNSVLLLAEQLAKTTSSLPQLSDLHVYLKFLHGTALSEAVSAARFMEIIHTLTKQAKASSSFTFKTAVFNTLEEVLFTTSLNITPALSNDLIDLTEQLVSLKSIPDEEYPNASMYQERGELLLRYLRNRCQEKHQELRILGLFCIHITTNLLLNPISSNDLEFTELVEENFVMLLKSKILHESSRTALTKLTEDIGTLKQPVIIEKFIDSLISTSPTLALEILLKPDIYNQLQPDQCDKLIAHALNACHMEGDHTEALSKIWHLIKEFDVNTSSSQETALTLKKLLHFTLTYAEILKEKCSREIVEEACEFIHLILANSPRTAVTTLTQERFLAYTQETIKFLDAMNFPWAKQESGKLSKVIESMKANEWVVQYLQQLRKNPSKTQGFNTQDIDKYIRSFFELDRFPPYEFIEFLIDQEMSCDIANPMFHMTCFSHYVSVPQHRISHDYTRILTLNFSSLMQESSGIPWENYKSLIINSLPKRLARSLPQQKDDFLAFINTLIMTLNPQTKPLCSMALNILLNTVSIAQEKYHLDNEKLLSLQDWYNLLERFGIMFLQIGQPSLLASIKEMRKFLSAKDLDLFNELLTLPIKEILNTQIPPVATSLEKILSYGSSMQLGLVLSTFDISLHSLGRELVKKLVFHIDASTDVDNSTDEAQFPLSMLSTWSKNFINDHTVDESLILLREWLNQSINIFKWANLLCLYENDKIETNQINKAVAKENLLLEKILTRQTLIIKPEDFCGSLIARLKTLKVSMQHQDANEAEINYKYFDHLIRKLLMLIPQLDQTQEQKNLANFIQELQGFIIYLMDLDMIPINAYMFTINKISYELSKQKNFNYLTKQEFYYLLTCYDFASLFMQCRTVIKLAQKVTNTISEESLADIIIKTKSNTINLDNLTMDQAVLTYLGLISTTRQLMIARSHAMKSFGVYTKFEQIWSENGINKWLAQTGLLSYIEKIQNNTAKASRKLMDLAIVNKDPRLCTLTKRSRLKAKAVLQKETEAYEKIWLKFEQKWIYLP